MPVPKQKETLSRFLDPMIVSRLSKMDLKARLIVEGFIAGMHRSPYHGFSVEFAEYRQYIQGDNIKNIDWKAYGKTDRFYVKEFEEETNLRATILLDKSGSMGFVSDRQGRGNPEAPSISKLTYGALLAASLSYLMIKQHDAVGLYTFDEKIRTLIPHRSARNHLLYLLSDLEKVIPQGKTAVSSALHKIAEQLKRRGLVVLISDLMDDPEEVLMGLKHFRHRQHEVIVFHVLDLMELDLSYRKEVEFEDMENLKRLRVESPFVRADYRKAVRNWEKFLNKGCKQHQIEYSLLVTSTPFDVALTSYLNKRRRLG